LGIGVLLKAFEAGIRVPEDMAIVGCGNFHFSDTLRVPLSSVDQNTPEIGLQTCEDDFQLTQVRSFSETEKDNRCARVSRTGVF
jgi:DNA-binding LacI/PurR family transcriptional regulator